MEEAKKPLRQPGVLVYLAGIGTSLLALWGVHALNDAGTNIMGWYANYIIPVGALLVGVASGLGYAVGSRVLQVKLSRSFLWGMLLTGMLDYVAAQYLTYLHILEKHHASEAMYPFMQYFRDITEGMVFKSSRSSGSGAEMGMFGYFFKLLEMIGFALGTMLPSLTVFGIPYCKHCQVYLKPHKKAFVHSTESWSNVGKLKRKERGPVLEQAVAAVLEKAGPVSDLLLQIPFPETLVELQKLDQTEQKETLARVTYILKKCPKCEAHHITTNLFNFQPDKKFAVTTLVEMDKTSMTGVAPI